MSLNIDKWRARMGSFIQKFSIKITVGTRNYRYLNIKQEIFLYVTFDSWRHRSQSRDSGKKHPNTFHAVDGMEIVF